MLYITTRNKNDAYTAHKALTCDQAADGGRFIPFRIPKYSSEEIASLKEKSFNQVVADVLNMFFSSRLERWDMDFCIGKNVLRIAPMSHRIVVGELWHNLDGCFSYVENAIYQKLTGDACDGQIKDWVQLSVRIAILFGLYGELLRHALLEPGQTFDISVPNDRFLSLMAAWYCRAMGLPLKTIICSCDDDGNMWDFINRGVLNTVAIPDELKLNIERLLQGAVSCEEVNKFHQACLNEKAYAVDAGMLTVLNQGLFCSVAGKDRIKKTINSVFRSNTYIMDGQTALCYSGLQDYRAKTGESELTVLLAERTPMSFAADICESTGITAEKLSEYINRS